MRDFVNLFPEGFDFPLSEEERSIVVDSEGCTREKAINLMEQECIFALLKLSEMLPHPQEAKMFYKTALQARDSCGFSNTKAKIQTFNYITKNYLDLVAHKTDLAAMAANYSPSSVAGFGFMEQRLKSSQYNGDYDSLGQHSLSYAYGEGDELHSSPVALLGAKRKAQETKTITTSAPVAGGIIKKEDAEVKVEIKAEGVSGDAELTRFFRSYYEPSADESLELASNKMLKYGES